jgi:hypothetical protein
MPFAALHESGSGTNRTNRVGLEMSVVWEDRKWLVEGQTGAIDPELTSDHLDRGEKPLTVG